MLKDERYWNIKLLNKWFAISSIIFMGSFIWMFIDDNDDEFKVYQRAFRKMEVEIAESKLLSEIDKIKDERLLYDEKLINAQKEFDLKRSELDHYILQLDTAKAKFYKANMNFLGFKAIVDAEKYNYETQMLKNKNSNKTLNLEKTYFNQVKELDELKLIKENKESLVAEIEGNIKSLSSEKVEAQDELNKVLRDVNIADRKLKKLDRNNMSFANKIGDIVRDLPILDFLAPYYKVEQVVLPEIKYNVNFAHVPEVDRCTSCHLGITNPEYIDAPQPFTTHPNLDLYLSSSSPHAYEQFGCTSCHAGRGRGTSFTSATHTPSSEEQKKEWEEKYHWHEMHHWLKPMLPTKYTEASCLKCHNNETYIKGAEKLTKGLQLISQNGCNNCHHIETHKPERKIGPDLRRLDEKLSKEWTGKWIRDPQKFRHNTKMPAFFGQSNNSDSVSVQRNETEIATIVEYLFPNGDKNKSKNQKYLGDKDKGEKLFNTIGCKGCHIIEQNPENIPQVVDQEILFRQHGPNLIGIGTKTNPDWLYKWLKNPSDYWHDTAMPSLRLSDQEAKDLTAYLFELKNNEFEKEKEVELDKIELDNITFSWLKKAFPVEESKQKMESMDHRDKVNYVADKSIRHYGCYTCHNIDGYEQDKPIGAELTYEGSKSIHKLDFGFKHDLDHKNYVWFYEKLKDPRQFDHGKKLAYEDKARMPNFYFNDDEIEAIVTALLGFNDDKIGPSLLAETHIPDQQIYKGNKLIIQNNCQGCHVIDGVGGHIVENYSSSEFAPPNLNTEGAKVQPDWLFKWFHDPYTIRPNLQVRMPSFNMSDEEWNSIIKAFQHRDNDLLDFASDLTYDISTTHFKAGIKLHELGACNNCHFYGKEFPVQDPQTWAPNLALTKERLQPEWVIEWLRDPQAIMPGTKMPAPYLPDSDILSLPGSITDWGKFLVEIDGDQELMLEGLRDYLYSIEGKIDISSEIKDYFKKNGYNFDEEYEEDEEDEDW